MTDEKGPAVVAGPALCPGSGSWGGWGWQWRPCPECHARVDVDEETLALVDHEGDVEPVARTVAEG